MKVIKNNIKSFLITIILLGGIVAVYATTIASSSVSYTTSSNNSVATVEDALDDLYPKYFPEPVIECYNGVCGKLTYKYWNDEFNDTTYQKNVIPATTYARRALLEQNYSDFADEPIYIRSVLINGNVVGHELCFWEDNNQKEFCIAPNYWVGTIGTDDVTVAENTEIKLQRDMQNALGLESTDVSCYSSSAGAFCYVGDFHCDAFSSGRVSCCSNITYGYCDVNSGGSAYCYVDGS